MDKQSKAKKLAKLLEFEQNLKANPGVAILQTIERDIQPVLETQDVIKQDILETQDGVIEIAQKVNELEVSLETKIDNKVASIPHIPGARGFKGEDGKDYILTPKDKEEIASKITVPVVEKVIEKTEVIKEQPIVKTEIVKETTIKEDLAGEAIVNKINDLPLTDDKKIDASHIKNLTKTISGSYPVGVSEAVVRKLISEIPPSSSVGTFTDLTDTPNSYSSQGGKGVRVKGTEDGLEFYTTTDSDEKVKLNASDPTAGYLDDKVATYGFLDDSSAFATAAQGSLADTALQSESDPLSLHLTDIAATDLSDFNNDLGNYGGWITDISGQDLSTADNSTSQFITTGDIPAETDPEFNAWLLATPPLYSETDPVFSAWLLATPPLYNLDGALLLDQTTPQTFTNLGGGTGLMKVTAGVLGLDTSTYLTSVSGQDHSTLTNLAWSTAGHTIDTHVLPTVSGASNLGSMDYKFGNIYSGGYVYTDKVYGATSPHNLLILSTVGMFQNLEVGYSSLLDLDLSAGTSIDFNINNVEQITLTDGKLAPTADNDIALGDTTHGFSDLFLGSGGVINWDNGNATLTHSAGVLTFNVFPVTPSSAPDADYEVANKKYVDDNAGGLSVSINIDQSGGTSDTYGILVGDVDGANKVYTVSAEEYVSGSLTVYLNGQLQTQGTGEDWVETTPASGTFTFAVAPEVGDEITVVYKVSDGASGDADTLDGFEGSAYIKKTEFTPWDKITEDTWTGIDTTGLVSYYKMDETTGTTIADSHGTNNGSVVTLSVSANGILNGAVDVQANNNVVRIPDSASLNFGSSMSAFIWVKPESAVSNAHVFAQWDVASKRAWRITTTTVSNQFIVSLSPDGSFTTSVIKQYTFGTYATGVWAFVGFTWNNGVLKVYYNGKEITSPTKVYDGAFTSIHNNNADLSMGAFLDGGVTQSTSRYVGLLDEAQLWNRVLSGADILYLYNQGLAKAYPLSGETVLSTPNSIETDRFVIAQGFYTTSEVAKFDNTSSLDKLNNADKWMKDDGTINYDKHYASVELGDGRKGLSVETRIAEMEKMIWELNNKITLWQIQK